MEIGRKLHISKHILYLMGGALLLLTLFGSLLWAGAPKPKSTVKQGKIQEIVLENDQAKLRIQRNGVVEISTAERTVFQFWDQDRIDRLFSLLERTDWSGFDSRLKPGQTGYLLRLTTDTGVITIAIPDDSGIIPPVIQELISLFTALVQQATGGMQASPSPLPFVSPIPSPINQLPSPTPKPASPAPSFTPQASVTPTPTAPPVGGSSQQLFVCKYTGTTAKRRILSETICDLIE